jgi:hypothetical protein
MKKPTPCPPLAHPDSVQASATRDGEHKHGEVGPAAAGTGLRSQRRRRQLAVTSCTDTAHTHKVPHPPPLPTHTPRRPAPPAGPTRTPHRRRSTPRRPPRPGRWGKWCPPPTCRWAAAPLRPARAHPPSPRARTAHLSQVFQARQSWRRWALLRPQPRTTPGPRGTTLLPSFSTEFLTFHGKFGFGYSAYGKFALVLGWVHLFIQWPASPSRSLPSNNPSGCQPLLPLPHPPEQLFLQVRQAVLCDLTSDARLKLGLWCVFLRRAEASLLRRTLNRDFLVEGLQEGAMDVLFQLKGCSDAEFAVLCKAMTVQGPAVRRVVSEEPLNFHPDRHIDAFVAALASCSHLVELRWVLFFLQVAWLLQRV